MSAVTDVDLGRARAAAAGVLDPELPVLSIADLGVLREVLVAADGVVEAVITPTYSGCPAMDAIRGDLLAALRAAGFPDARVRTALAPAWSTDWITAEGRRRLQAHGIAPPGPAGAPGVSGRSGGARRRGGGPVPVALSVRCPQCGSPDTAEVSRFGATPCTALWRCRACAEPFEHVKPL